MAGDALVGRDRESAELRRRLADARAGRGALVLIEADAGAGKTALAQALVDEARATGVRTVWGSCLEGDGAEPYRPWLQILSRLGHPLAGSGDEDQGTRSAMFAGVVDVLRAEAGEGLLVVIDDLHWADVASVRLLRSVAADVTENGMLVVGLYRGHDVYPFAELAGALQDLRRERGTVHLGLGRLGPGEIDALATRVVGAPPDRALLRTVRDRAEGNPLYVLELLRLAAIATSADGWLPRGIRDVIGRRLDHLPDEARMALRSASVLGREFTPGTLGAMVGRSASDLMDALEPALAAGLIHPADRLALRFDHALTHEVAYAELGVAARQRLHARAAEALESAAGRQGTVDELAHHLRQAAPLGYAERALTATLEAADRARGRFAHEHAAHQYRHALALLPVLPAGSVREEDLLLDLARCQYRSGDVDSAWRTCVAAADLGRAAGDPLTLADAATVLRGVDGVVGIAGSPLAGEIHALCREVLPGLADKDPVREARVLAQLAATADPWTGHADPDAGVRALTAAEATADPEALFLALQARHAELINTRHAEERLALGDRTLRLGQETGVGEYSAWGHSWRLDALYELGRRVALNAELIAFVTLVGRLREPLWQWRLVLIQASLALLEGRYDETRGLLVRAVETYRQAGGDEEIARFATLIFESQLACQTGDGFAPVEAAVRRFAEQGPFSTRGWIALVLVSMDRLDEARVFWRELAGHLSAMPVATTEWLVAWGGNAEICIRLADRDTAPEVYATLFPFAGFQVVGLANGPSSGPVSLLLGRLAALLGNTEQAEAHLRDSLAESTAMGSPPFAASARWELSALLRARGRAADRAEAAGLRAEAVRSARQLGLAPVLDRLEPGTDGRSALSRREEEVAGLVAEGLSNRAIAQRLHLSGRTVENHIAHIMTKLGVESRTRIATWHTTRGR